MIEPKWIAWTLHLNNYDFNTEYPKYMKFLFKEKNCILLDDSVYGHKQEVNYIASCGCKGKITYKKLKNVKDTRCNNCRRRLK